ncbi:Bowman-Birk type trypsin inhibitor [Zea mays]|uniref:Bowman-Birk type trypsin inhibitor n=1 Tax=Zea mays TaxID=4577 RepID=A0A1D6MM92_MAIZE|nr:Bowman-Birk type trypsin inhibitor [Zea mays]
MTRKQAAATTTRRRGRGNAATCPSAPFLASYAMLAIASGDWFLARSRELRTCLLFCDADPSVSLC